MLQGKRIAVTGAFGALGIVVMRALAAAGATFQDVVKTSLFVVGLKPEHVPVIRAVRGKYVSAEHPPASTLVGVSALVGSDWLIEIEAVAVVPE